MGVDEQNIVMLPTSFLTDRLSQMRLSHSQGTADQHIASLPKEFAGAQRRPFRQVRAVLKVKDKTSRVLAVLICPRRRRIWNCFCAPIHLVFEQTGEEVLVTPLSVYCLTVSGTQCLEHAREAKSAQLVSESIVHIHERAPSKAEKSSWVRRRRSLLREARSVVENSVSL